MDNNEEQYDISTFSFRVREEISRVNPRKIYVDHKIFQ